MKVFRVIFMVNVFGIFVINISILSTRNFFKYFFRKFFQVYSFQKTCDFFYEEYNTKIKSLKNQNFIV
jgi:hypothetical protein